MNKLIEINYPRFILHGEGDIYSNIGINVQKDVYRYECFSIRIKDKLYGLKPIIDGATKKTI